MGQNNGMIQSYLQEGLVSLIPNYRGEGSNTQVVTLQGTHQERRSLSWLVELMRELQIGGENLPEWFSRLKVVE